MEMVTWKCQVTFSVERSLFLCSLSVEEYKGDDVTWLTDPLSVFLPPEATPQLITSTLLLGVCG